VLGVPGLPKLVAGKVIVTLDKSQRPKQLLATEETARSAALKATIGIRVLVEKS